MEVGGGGFHLLSASVLRHMHHSLLTDIIISFKLSIHIQKSQQAGRAGNICMK